MNEETRRGPWTEQEDLQLVRYVRLFGERRWDFIAKVSGLNRTGKSCRLRWVNYLHPGLKRGRMSPQEQRLVLELHSKWGNRWSRIARKLPGRTDNEIKNYWRTHLRRNVQEQKRTSSPSSSLSSSSLSSSSMSCVTSPSHSDPRVEGYSMDQIWNEIAASEEAVGGPIGDDTTMPPTIASPVWDFGSDFFLWKLDDEELKVLSSYGVSSNTYQHGRES